MNTEKTKKSSEHYVLSTYEVDKANRMLLKTIELLGKNIHSENIIQIGDTTIKFEIKQVLIE